MVDAISCEAVKVAYRQTKDGMVVSFAIHPNEMHPALALLPVGARVMLAVAEIGDDEQPLPAKGETPRETRIEKPGPERTNDTTKNLAAAERFRNLPPMEQDVARAAMLTQDETFQFWLAGEAYDFEATTIQRERHADILLKARLNIRSKSEIGEDRAVNERWHVLLTTYLKDTNQLAEIRG